MWEMGGEGSGGEVGVQERKSEGWEGSRGGRCKRGRVKGGRRGEGR